MRQVFDCCDMRLMRYAIQDSMTDTFTRDARNTDVNAQ